MTILCAQHFVPTCPTDRTSLGFRCPWGACHWLKEEDGVYVVEVRDEPSVYSSGSLYGTYTLNSSETQRLQDLLAKTTVPLVRGDKLMTGCDGSTTVLSFMRKGLGASYTWWCEPPKGWENLDKIASIVLRLGYCA